MQDIHGRLDLLFKSAIAKIVEHSAGNRSAIATSGDYVDRGPCSRESDRAPDGLATRKADGRKSKGQPRCHDVAGQPKISYLCCGSDILKGSI
jgi:hypothetical protein